MRIIISIVEGTLNGHGTRSLWTLAHRRRLSIRKQQSVPEQQLTALWGVGGNGAGGLHGGLSRTSVKELGIGSFKLANAEVAVAHVSGDILLSKSAAESNAGVLGQEYLSSNFAVVDIGGSALYLRRPDSR